MSDCIAQFSSIAAMAHGTPEGASQPPIGLFTSQKRDDWARMREQLLKLDKTNADSFHEIENTLFCVCLDDSSPANDQEMSQLSFIGNGHNRYYDRNFQMISFANGQTCVNAEHTWADALIVSDLFDHINEAADELMKRTFEASKSLPEELLPKRLSWVMSATTGEGLERAKEHYVRLRDSIDMCAYKFNAFGKTAISKSFGLSPDAFIQMAMQLAHLRLHKKVVLTYESSHTRRFWHGRTEAVRSASSQSTAFAKAMDALPVDDRDTKKYLLQQACEAHVNTIKHNMAGQGFDRHLLMLKVISISQKLPLPELYRDKVHFSLRPFHSPRYSCHRWTHPSLFYSDFVDFLQAWMLDFELSTSQTPSQRGSGGGFGPVASEG
jgi:carnitine O-acetyltransferase